MPDDVKPFIWIPLAVLWLATFAIRVIPPLRKEFSAPQVQRFAVIVGLAALVGILLVIWVL